jgi:hypothetical protein
MDPRRRAADPRIAAPRGRGHLPGVKEDTDERSGDS